ncbi:hypothetical protein, partial [Nocardiopsis sp. B62]|uniref:hypothetical protein n=1 Tax=Nocardiopsis sp. B62 TaxID=2824874 RepID=UPI001B35DA73
SRKNDTEKPPNWTSDSGDSVDIKPNRSGSEPEPALVPSRNDGDVLTESKKTPAPAPVRGNATDIDAPGSGNRSGNEIANANLDSDGRRSLPGSGPATENFSSRDTRAQEPSFTNKQGESSSSGQDTSATRDIGVDRIGQPDRERGNSVDQGDSYSSPTPVDNFPTGDGKVESGGEGVNPTGGGQPSVQALDSHTAETSQSRNKWDDYVDFGNTDASGRWFDGNGVAHIDKPDYVSHAQAYDRIREATGDVDLIAEVTGIDRGVINRIKDHIFNKSHEVAVGPNDVRVGKFTPAEHIAKWWEGVQRDRIPNDEKPSFRKWLAHESVESKLMEWGMPYLSSDSSAFSWDPDLDEYSSVPTEGQYGAHNLAPSEGMLAPFGHYLPEWGKPEGDLKGDLSNSEEIAREIFERLHKNE